MNAGDNTTGRIHSMDMLRAVAMYLGIILHASIVYQIEPRPGWPKDIYSSSVFDFVYHFLHSFRLQLFFLLAGFFANLLIEKIGIVKFVAHRKGRILYPFLISVVLITPLSSIAFNYNTAITAGQDVAGAWVFAIKRAAGWNGFYHLWFLYYLMIFYGINLALLWVGEKWKLRGRLILGTNGFYVVVYTLALFLISVTLYHIDIEPWTGMKPRVNQMMYYGLFYAIGYGLWSKRQSIGTDWKTGWMYLIFGVIASVSVFVFPVSDFPLGRIGYMLVVSIQSVFLVFGFLLLFAKYFEVDSWRVRYFSDASYWIYIIHFPIITLSQLVLLNFGLVGPLKFWIVLMVCTVISVVTYAYFVRYSWIGNLLNGKRERISKNN